MTSVDFDKGTMGKLAWRTIGEGGVSLAPPKVPMETPFCGEIAPGHLREAGQLAVDPAKEAKEGCLLGVGPPFSGVRSLS